MFCQNCGAEINDKAVVCVKCGVAVSRKSVPVNSSEENAALGLIIPIGRSGWSIAAGYLGLFSLVVPFVGLILGIGAVICGVIAVSDIKKHPEKRGLGRAWTGIVLGSVMTIIWLIAVFAVALD